MDFESILSNTLLANPKSANDKRKTQLSICRERGWAYVSIYANGAVKVTNIAACPLLQEKLGITDEYLKTKKDPDGRIQINAYKDFILALYTLYLQEPTKWQNEYHLMMVKSNKDEE